MIGKPPRAGRRDAVGQPAVHIGPPGFVERDAGPPVEKIAEPAEFRIADPDFRRGGFLGGIGRVSPGTRDALDGDPHRERQHRLRREPPGQPAQGGDRLDRAGLRQDLHGGGADIGVALTLQHPAQQCDHFAGGQAADDLDRQDADIGVAVGQQAGQERPDGFGHRLQGLDRSVPQAGIV